MKIALADLKKTIQKIEELSLDTHVRIKLVDVMHVSFQDKYGAQVEITLYEGNSLPKIRKEDKL